VTAAELIAALEAYPGDAVVMMEFPQTGNAKDITGWLHLPVGSSFYECPAAPPPRCVFILPATE
jgi:hypothetical protein